MRIVKHFKFADIKEKYKNLVDSSTHYFQSLEFIMNKLRFMKLKHIFLMTKYVFVEVVSDKNETIMILPLEKIKGNLKVISLLDYYDIVYNKKFDKDTLLKALNLIVNELNVDLTFENVLENSMLYQIMNLDNSNMEVVSKREGGKINLFGLDYDKYFSQISKSNRQNIRTAYNRLAKDEKEYRLDIFKGYLNKKLSKNLASVYRNRYQEKNGCGFIKKTLLKFYEPIIKMCSNSKLGFTAVLYIDGIIAGYLCGFQNACDNSIIVPRLAINGEYNRYSPGLILINELIKENFNSNYFDILDLGVGDENYKKVMCASMYDVYKIKLKQM